MGSVATAKPHAVCVSYPAQGHINPMLKLAKLLHSKGFHITFLNTLYNHRRLLRSRGPSALHGLPGFRFDAIPDGLPDSDNPDVTQDIPSLCLSIQNNCLAPFRVLLAELNSPASAVPPVTCIVSDGSMSWSLDAAEELGIPEVLFRTPSACGLMAYLHFKDLVDRGLTPVKDAGNLNKEYLEMEVDGILGMDRIRFRDLPSFVRTSDADDIIVNYIIRETSRLSRASAIVLNTFYDLEAPVLEAMAEILPPVYAVGPLCLLAKQIPTSAVASLETNLWKEDRDCLGWLQGKPRASVVYVNFGSITAMTNQQLLEFAWGLANSGHEFLWVIRPDLVRGGSAVLPLEFLEETKKRGLIISGWCPQEKVLDHPAVGGFLTHCGWNSTLESIAAGVPMLCWPFFAEQQTNCRYLCSEWGIGMEIEGDAKRVEVEELIRELMSGEKGRRMREKAMEWKVKAHAATARGGGRSTHNVDLLVNVLLSK